MFTRTLLGTVAAVTALVLFQVPLFASDDTAIGDLIVGHPWSRPTDALAKTGAVYLVVTNKAGTADRLVAVATPIAGEAGIHMNVNEGGMMHMRPINGLDVPANGSATLKPGGFHIMLMDLKTPLKEGTTYPLTLTFEKAGPLTVQVQVERPPGSPAPSESGMDHGMDHGDAAPMHDHMGRMKH
jgi:hypothetical protein